LVMVWSRIQGNNNGIAAGDFLDWQKQSTSFQGLWAWTGFSANLGGAEGPEQVPGTQSTPGQLSGLGVPPVLGRDFEIRQIIDILMKGVLKRLNNLGFTLELTAEAKSFIADKGYDSQFGARPLHRAIQKYLEDPLAEEILNMNVKNGDVLIADSGDDVVREVNHSTGVITAIAGTERTVCSASPCGDGGAPTNAKLNSPTGVAVDSAGNVLIADYKTDRTAPAGLAKVPTPYVGQLALYRAILGRIYPVKTIRAALVFTEGPNVIDIPGATMDAALAEIVSKITLR